MSGGTDKTEKPTPKRVSDARERGQVAKSTDLNAAILLGVVSMLVFYAGGYGYQVFYSMMETTFRNLDPKPMTIEYFKELYIGNFWGLILVIFPFMAALVTVAILSNLLQVKPLFTVKPLEPKFDKLNPINGFKRLWAMKSIVEVIKALLKMGVIGLAGYMIIQGHLSELMATNQMELPVAVGVVMNVVGKIALWAVIIYLVLGVADFWYQKYELEKSLRMTKQEVKDEYKNLEGDPKIKGQIRQMGQRMLQKRQLSAVPTADVVITNPTHYAIALKYDPDVYPAPHVVAKGMDHFAQKIKEIAKENGVPTVENKPLAQSLYKLVDVNYMIPPDLFVAVAEVLAFVFSRQKGRKARKPNPN